MRHKGWPAESVSDERILAPFIVADSAYVIYEDYIKPLKLKFQYKKHINNFMRCYDALNKDFFKAFNEEETGYVIDKMDDLHSAIATDIELLRLSIIGHFSQYSLEIRNNLGSFMALLHLTQCARILYGELVKKSTYDGLVPARNEHLEGMMSYADELFAAYSRQYAVKSRGVDLNDIKEIADTSRVLCRKVMKTLGIGPTPGQTEAA